MPRIVDYDERKREIAQSALTLFSKQGYYDSSFSDIASACRLSRSNIYNYFKNSRYEVLWPLCLNFDGYIIINGNLKGRNLNYEIN